MRRFREPIATPADNAEVNTRSLLRVALGVWITVGALSVFSGAQGADLSFSGLFDVTITTTSSTPVSLTHTGLTAVLGWGDASAQMNAQLSDSIFDTLTLSGSAPLGPIDLNSSFQFNPSTAEFLSWQSSASFSLLDLAVTGVTRILSPQTESYTQWSASGTAGDIGFQSSVKLGICPFEFWESSLCGSWEWFDCGASMSVCGLFDDAVGFRSLTATMTGLELFEIWGILASFGTAIEFSLEQKVLTPTASVQTDWFLCVDIELLGEIDVSPPVTFENLGMYGIQGECAVGNCLTFAFADSLDDAKNSSVTGKADYFERFGISGCLPSCCGDAGEFEVNAYFERPPAPSGTLFGLGLITASFDIQLFENFSFAFAGEFPTVGSGWEFAWTFRVLW